MQQVVSPDLRTPTGIARSLTRHVRSQQRVETQPAAQRLIQHFEPGVHEHHRAMRVGQDMLYDPVAPVRFGIGEPVENTVPFRVFDPVIQVALFLVAEGLAVADEKLKIARVRLVDGRVVDFVDDAVTEREPDPAARMISGAQAFFCAGGPAGLDSGRAERA